MNSLILNRESFELPVDGWYQLAPVGEFAHEAAGVLQVVDAAACEAMVNAFQADSLKPNFAGLLIDFDHFSLDGKLKSEAAGWIVAVDNRDSGLWGKIRWSDTGEDCVRGGRYRFISPVWARSDCEDLGPSTGSGQAIRRVRPVRLLNAAVTNDPNLKGMVPLSNRAQTETNGKVANAPTAPMFRWVLGDGDRHCPSCAALAGQVHSMADWDAAGLRPGSAKLFCTDCHCSLVETTEPEQGRLEETQVKEDVVNREKPVLANEWSAAARAASIAVRKAKALARRQGAGAPEDAPGVVRALPIEPGDDPDIVSTMPVDEDSEGVYYALQAVDGYQSDARAAFQERYGYFPSDPDEIREAEEMADVPEEYRTGGEVSPRELAERIAGEGPSTSAGDGDPEFQRQEREADEAGRREDLAGQDDALNIHDRAEDLIAREADGESLSRSDKAFLRRYREVIGDLSEVRNRASDAALMAVRRDKGLARGRRRNG